MCVDVTRPQLTSTDLNDIKKIPHGERDNHLFHLANVLVKSGLPQEEVEYYLSLMFYYACDNPEDRVDIQAKVRSALNRSKRSEKVTMGDVREWVMTSSGIFLTSDVINWHQVTSRKDKKNVVNALLRLEKEGLIVKHGERRGCYRRVETEYDEIDAEEMELGDVVDIKLPFLLEEYVEILPKDLIVIAGTPNAGKTAVLLNMVYQNMGDWPCFYFSTEMSRQACKRRMVRKDPPPLNNKWKFKFVENFLNFEDIIKPDSLNFIDYVEQNEGEAYKIPGILAKIQRKLRRGIAIVALQKNQGVAWGIGGQQTKAKPALFLTVEQDYPGQILRVVKAKCFKDFNPNGFCLKFKIINGVNLKQETSWGPE